mgnify:CR=1 FL=1|jgi:hypothetical protein|tara:strand:+ start:234 stop:1133 length:900 start_codon:yes stop_codon:yes gene_type:complete
METTKLTFSYTEPGRAWYSEESPSAGTLSFDPSAHHYYFDGERVEMSVTKICDAYAIPFSAASGWAAKCIRNALVPDVIKRNQNLRNWLKELYQKDSDGKLKIKPEKPLTLKEGTWFETGGDVEAWGKRICQAPIRERDAAGDIGRTAHAYIEAHSQGTEPDLPDHPAQLMAMALRDWYDQNVETPLAVERRVYHPIDRYAGTLDLLAAMKWGGNYVIDWKGVNELRKTPKAAHVGQGIAYCKCLQIEGFEIDGFILVEVVRETGKLRATKYTEIDAHYKTFQAALNLARYKPSGENIT